MSQCQCPYRAFPGDRASCTAEITQEDMLCDGCRVTVWCMFARGVDVSQLLDQA